MFFSVAGCAEKNVRTFESHAPCDQWRSATYECRRLRLDSDQMASLLAAAAATGGHVLCDSCRVWCPARMHAQQHDTALH